MALPTSGEVVIETTVGDIRIELWAKETPKTCRNFIALALEGYYDNVIFHRVVPSFLVQAGDKTGTGFGGESFYGDVFEDEIHPRLRLPHRGIVAMANQGQKNTNDSQFIITLDRAEELHGKHTVFGRVIGDTIYNVMRIGEVELDSSGEGRPVYPPKIKAVRVLENPFDDIVPRITAAERKVQAKARQAAQKEREEEIRMRGAKKNVKLLSFEDEEEGGEEVIFKKKSIVRPDLADPVPDFVTAPVTAPAVPKDRKEYLLGKPAKASSKEATKPADLSEIRKGAAEKPTKAGARQTEIEKMEAEIRSMARKRAGEDDDDAPAKKKRKGGALAAELAKYQRGKKGGDKAEALKKLDAFTRRMETAMDRNTMDVEADEGELAEVDDDLDFLTHTFKDTTDNADEVRKAEEDYDVYDPRTAGDTSKGTDRDRDERLQRERERLGTTHGVRDEARVRTADVIDPRRRKEQAEEEERARKRREGGRGRGRGRGGR
ncbi:cyclophilin-like protein [Cylindrobasidium torrendii FP15055 ss-10]|uniref:Cyclophilin-like protein n=1 Tax=Cylindrobasidium torrendii FP15055 ss-10 TaxID=1314674 RepID=A0A0D7BJ34_9AGAR|nr:cyclophilin-like protein [Cylindrobasidium torrendii FP15055 ss-10]